VIKTTAIFFIIITIAGFSCQSNQTNRPNKKANRINAIALLPYKDFDTSLLGFIAKETEAFYHCKTVILPAATLPANAYYEPRNRYKADSLLLFQKKLQPSQFSAVAGLTCRDISTSNGNIKDWGVFGLGYCPGNTCVISVYRMQSTTLQQFKERLIKVLLHELGHNLGLPHCNYDSTCMMNDARGTMAQVDMEKKWLCPNCRKLLSN
jgi:archaemetzincin